MKFNKPHQEGVRIEKTMMIHKPASLLYQVLRNFENLPQFMNSLKSVVVLDDERSHWKAEGPAGSSVEWDAKMIEDIPNKIIRWRSVENAGLENSGSVHFYEAPNGVSTEVHVTVTYTIPGKAAGEALAKIFGRDPSRLIEDALHHFKQVMETGEAAAA